jgi:hypothetical protein
VLLFLGIVKVVCGNAIAEESPSLELLEFLGEWQTDSGEWIGPTSLDEVTLPDDGKEEDDAEYRD